MACVIFSIMNRKVKKIKKIKKTLFVLGFERNQIINFILKENRRTKVVL